MRRELTWFQQNFDGQHGVVKYSVRHTQDGKRAYGFDYEAPNEQLQGIAMMRGRSTWDERDIIEYHGNTLNEVITLCMPPQSVEQATSV